MQFDMRALGDAERYKILTSTVTPRPIAWITSRSREGVVNAAPFSFFNVMGSTPPIVTIGLMRNTANDLKDTAANILDTGEFVINLVSTKMAKAMNITCIDAPRHVSEIQLAQLQTRPAVVVAPPLIVGSPVSFECRNYSSIVTGPNQVVVIGEVIMAHVEDDYVINPERCHINNEALDLIARLHGSGWYVRAGERFQMQRPTWANWPPPPAVSE